MFSITQEPITATATKISWANVRDWPERSTETRQSYMFVYVFLLVGEICFNRLTKHPKATWPRKEFGATDGSAMAVEGKIP